MRNSWLALVSLAGLLAATTVDASADRGTRFLQSPDIHGDRIVFVYDDDLWLVASAGGVAHRLTDDGTPKYAPKFSPDGRSIAYSARQRQNLDIYVVPAGGGAARRVTWHPGDDRVEGWSRDGRDIVFSSDRANFAPADQARLFLVSARGGLARVLAMHKGFHASFSPDGRTLAYTPVRDAFQLWKRYRGGETTPIWLVNLDTFSHVEIPHVVASDTTPVWLKDGVYFRSDRDGVMSVYRYDPDTRRVSEVARNGDWDIVALAGSGHRLVYESEGFIFTRETSAPASTQVRVTVPGTERAAQPRLVDAAPLAREFELSPDGTRLLFEARGDLFVAPVNGGASSNLTRTAGIAERTPVWSADGGQIAYQSDESGEYRLYVRSVSAPSSARPLGSVDPGFVHQLRWSPDGHSLAYINHAFKLCWVGVGDGRHECIDSYARADRPVIWAPDASGIFYTERLPTFFHELRYVRVADRSVTAITDGMGDVRELTLSADGRYLFFLGAAEAGPTVTDYDYSRAVYRDGISWRVYGVALGKGAPSAFSIEAAARGETVRDLDVAGMAARIVPSTHIAGRIERLVAGPDAQLYLLRLLEPSMLSDLRSTAGAPRRAVVARALERVDRVSGALEGRIEQVDDFDLAADRSLVLLRSGARLALAATDAATLAATQPLSIPPAEVAVDPPAEWRQIYHEAWRMVRDYFYDNHTHGVNWPAIGARYETWLPDLRARRQLDVVLQEMLGELVNSHIKVLPAPAAAAADPSGAALPEKIGLLGADFVIARGRYQFSTVYRGSYWGSVAERGPLTHPDIDVKPGEYLLGVNGRELRQGDDLDERLAGFAGEPVELRVGPRPDVAQSRRIRVTPLASELALRQRAWVETNRRLVSEWSGGKVGYLYQPDTSGGGLTEFVRYFFPQTDRSALLIDERFNSGGADPDYQLDVLARTQVLWYEARDLPAFRSPLSIMTGPKAMLVNAEAGSGGDVYPYQFKRRGLGTVIGTRTWGGVQGGYRGASPATFVDGGAIRVGDLGTFSPEGHYILENSGFEPDIVVPVTPADDAAGVDPQLRRAVDHLLAELAKSPPRPVPKMERVDRSLR